jgi:molecular chaperone DnaK
MTELGDKLDPVDRNRLENAVNDVKSALSAEDDARIEATSRTLEKAWQELGAKLHQQAAQQPGAGAGPEAATGAAGPEVEADYEVVDDHEQA